MRKPKSEYAIQTVTNALRVLEEFAKDEELGVTELARRLNLHKNNAFRLLATLQERDWAEQCEDSDRYRLGGACLLLAQRFLQRRPVVRRARPMLERLAAELGETAHLGVLRGFDVVHLDGEQARSPLVAGLRIGEQLPAHCSALGKVLLGCGDEKELQRYDQSVLQKGELETFTPATVTDSHKVLDQMRHARNSGYAVDIEEWGRGLVCVAAPVSDSQGRVVAALSISAPVCRISEDRAHAEVSTLLVATAEALSRDLGRI